VAAGHSPSPEHNGFVEQAVQQELFPAASPPGPRIYSIGHSTRTLEELVAVLRHYGIERVVDIRHFPASRHNP
jgi:hypothetical protein